jgi:hypothetical protein
MKFDIFNRFTGKVQFTAEIECDENETYPIKLGLAVIWGAKNNADLRSANLRSADLQSADLRSADLQSANLQYANLRSADLRSANLQSANLQYANLSFADLQSADLQSADLRYAIGNMSEVKSLQFDTWLVTYTNEVLNIGCQSHSIDLWRKSYPRWIAAMDDNANEWWNKFGKIILALIDASPATKPEIKDV